MNNFVLSLVEKLERMEWNEKFYADFVDLTKIFSSQQKSGRAH